MKNCIGKLVMLVAIFLGVDNASAMRTHHINFSQVTPELNDFFEAHLPYLGTNKQPSSHPCKLSMAKIQQARNDNVNGIGVLNGVQEGDLVIIMGRHVTIVP